MATTKNISRNLGGDRLGSGAKMNVNLHAYNRSTHDLSRAWRSSMNVGTLIPFFVEPGLPGDSFSIDLDTIVRTQPAIGPLYGSYKMQLDMFMVPVRLYNGLLHNNMTKIGLNMSQVILPKINLEHKFLNPNIHKYEINGSQIGNDSLLAYLGIRGIGSVNWKIRPIGQPAPASWDIERKLECVPLLGYWDIVKNYYANKQEEVVKYISHTYVADETELTRISSGNNRDSLTSDFKSSSNSTSPVAVSGNTYQELETPMLLGDGNYNIKMEGGKILQNTNLQIILLESGVSTAYSMQDIFPNYQIGFDMYKVMTIYLATPDAAHQGATILGVGWEKTMQNKGEVEIKTCDLSNIDQLRIDILQATGLNNELVINNLGYEPYSDYCGKDSNGRNVNYYSQHGLALKTYQSDLLNNWLKTEWIDGPNGINQITAIDVSSGSFTVDALNLANKVYNMLNRIAVSGGSYEDYIEAVYSTEAMRRAETPVYIGGMSTEVVFEEVVSQAMTEDQPLGTLAGRGTHMGRRGGKIEMKCTEPCFIIGLASLTPRVDNSQGNKWFMTEIDTMDDWHKPALDGIGFEDLLQERGAWFGTMWNEDTQNWEKWAIGKSPAWINYMTAINESYGDFADEDKAMFMTLNRRYEYEIGARNPKRGIKDLTTYINPTKYNYSFADTTLEAQNFWVQIGIKCIARRVGSAKIIPYL